MIFCGAGGSPILAIPESGGEAAAVTTRLPEHQGHRYPRPLPSGTHFLDYVIETPEIRGVYVARTDGSQSRRLFDADTSAVYAPPGQLLYVRQGTLFAHKFDAVRLTAVGAAHLLADSVARDPLSIQLATRLFAD